MQFQQITLVFGDEESEITPVVDYMSIEKLKERYLYWLTENEAENAALIYRELLNYYNEERY